eukprot:8235184-Alexandrium_andersonii.AAC.1
MARPRRPPSPRRPRRLVGSTACARTTSEPLLVHFANCTSLGRKARAFLDSEHAHRYHFVCLVETHLLHHTGEAKALAKKGWRSHWADATPSQGGGTSGGVVICHRSHLKVHAAEQIAGQWKGSVPGAAPWGNHDWSLVTVSARGFQFALAGLYLTHGINITGVNCDKISSLLSAVSALRCPFVIAADWNCPPD